MKKYFFLFLTFLISACFTPSVHKAEYSLYGGLVLVVELTNAHPFLAEYNSELGLYKDGKEVAREKLFLDTGGFSDFNLYSCGLNEYQLIGYWDAIVVNSDSLSRGQCDKESMNYIGVFSWGNDRNWKFYNKEEISERVLTPFKGEVDGRAD